MANYSVLFLASVLQVLASGLPVPNNDDYLSRRQKMLDAERKQGVGGDITLSADESKANEILMHLKRNELDLSFKDGVPFPPEINFLMSKPLIEKSKVFQMLKMMPKGGVLHLHEVTMTDIKWLVKNATYRDNCYMCHDSQQGIQFHFFRAKPLTSPCNWTLVRNERQLSRNVTKFDKMLYNSMVLTTATVTQDINTVWASFEGVIGRGEGLTKYAPVLRDYIYQGLEEFRKDHVQYVEIRAGLSRVYDLDVDSYTGEETMAIYRDTIRQFVADHGDFSGANVIKTTPRFRSEADIMADVTESISLLPKFPDHFIGYDLVGQEDVGKPLLFYLDALRSPSRQNPPINLPYFFHAGETAWQGTSTDDNLIDAVLLNTTRIGHGYTLPKHPEVLRELKSRGIAVEVNPISNQVLKLVDDLRNHPASFLIDQGYPVVISSDDPATWGASGLSYDFYVTFMAMTGREDDIRVLKQLAKNSILYSGMSASDKAAAVALWEAKWNDFILKVIGQGVTPGLAG